MVEDPAPPTTSREEARLRLVCTVINGLMVNAREGESVNGYARDSVRIADATLALLYPEPEKKG